MYKLEPYWMVNYNDKFIKPLSILETNMYLNHVILREIGNYFEEKISKYQNSNINTPDIFYQLDTFSIFEVPII